MTTPLLDAAEVARRLGMKRGTVLDLARKGLLPCVRPGPKVIRFDWEEVLRVSRERERQTVPT